MKCPISGVIFVDPVINFSGNIYDHEEIMATYKNQKNKNDFKEYTDPVSRKKSKNPVLVKCH